MILFTEISHMEINADIRSSVDKIVNEVHITTGPESTAISSFVREHIHRLSLSL